MLEVSPLKLGSAIVAFSQHCTAIMTNAIRQENKKDEEREKAGQVRELRHGDHHAN